MLHLKTRTVKAMCEAVVSGIGAVAGTITGYLAKQLFIVYELDTVRRAIDACVTQVARQYFGSFGARALGYGTSLLLAIPVTNFIGDIIWTSISEGIQATTVLVGQSVGLFKKETQRTTALLLKAAAKTASVVLGYTSKCLVVHYSMPYVHEALLKIVNVATPILCNNIVGTTILIPLLNLVATAYTPTVTIFLGDLVDFAVRVVLNAVTEMGINAIVPPPAEKIETPLDA